MYFTRPTGQGTGLLLSLALLLHCFTPASSAAPHRSASGGHNLFGLASAPTALSPLPLPDPEADLVIYASAEPSTIIPGDMLTLNVNVYNYGPDQATGANVTTTLPPDVDVNTASTPVGSCTLTPLTGGSTAVDCPLGDMNAYETQTATINATVDLLDGDNLQLSLTTGSTTADPVTADNTATLMVLVRASESGPGGKLAFVTYRDGDAEIYTTNADGTGVVNLTNDAGYDWEPAWSPDGTQIVFNSDRSSEAEVWLMDSDGSNQTRLTTNGSNGIYFVWSPDGTKIAWQNWDSSTDRYDICVINADGTGFSNLTNDADYQDRPQWSPDSTKIVYQQDVTDTLTQNTYPDIFVMNANGSSKTNLTSSPDAGEFTPVWSPNGTQIAFSRSYDDEGIYVMDSDGSDQVNLTETNDDGFPSWSPDGAQIAFSRFISYTNMIYVMDADGSDQTPVFTGNYNSVNPVVWSPDGDGVAFDIYQNGNGEIYVVNVDGSGLTNVTSDVGEDFEARWQPT